MRRRISFLKFLPLLWLRGYKSIAVSVQEPLLSPWLSAYCMKELSLEYSNLIGRAQTRSSQRGLGHFITRNDLTGHRSSGNEDADDSDGGDSGDGASLKNHKAVAKYIKANHPHYGSLGAKGVADALKGHKDITPIGLDTVIHQLNDMLGLAPLIFGLARIVREAYHLLDSIKLLRPLLYLLAPLINGAVGVLDNLGMFLAGEQHNGELIVRALQDSLSSTFGKFRNKDNEQDDDDDDDNGDNDDD